MDEEEGGRFPFPNKLCMEKEEELSELDDEEDSDELDEESMSRPFCSCCCCCCSNDGLCISFTYAAAC